MIGDLFIDGKDAYSAYGISIAYGGYDGLLSFPELKPIDNINWHEMDGVEVDLSAPVFDTKEFPITFNFNKEPSSLKALTGVLSDKAYHDFNFAKISRSLRLRLVSHSDLQTLQYLGVATLVFADDFPLDGYSYNAPSSQLPTQGNYKLDGRPLSDYGIRVLMGTLDSVKKAPGIKPNLLRNISTLPGAIYDGEVVTFEKKDVTINCLFTANDLDEMWNNHDAFMYDLVRPEARKLYVEFLKREVDCFYAGGEASEFYINGKTWVKLALTMTLVNYRPMYWILDTTMWDDIGKWDDLETWND